MTTPSVISVVDDDASVRAAMSNFLRALGCVVHTFGAAKEFLASPHLNDTSCVIADVQMPTMNGLELLAQMRMQGYTTPFIFITAFPDEDLRAQVLKAGACFLVKPCTTTSLIACLEAVLAPQQGRVGA